MKPALTAVLVSFGLGAIFWKDLHRRAEAPNTEAHQSAPHGRMETSTAVGLPLEPSDGIAGRTTSAQPPSQSTVDPQQRYFAYCAAVDQAMDERDYACAGLLVAQIPDDPTRLRVAAHFVDRWARDQPALAAQWAAELPEDAARVQILAHVGPIWAAQDPRGAASFAVSLPPGAAREQMLTQTILFWCSRDIAATGEWLGSCDVAVESDGAMVALATHPRIVAQSPATALAWANNILTPETRFTTMKAILQEWSLRDAPAARNYVQQAAIFTPEQRQTLIGLVDFTFAHRTES